MLACSYFGQRGPDDRYNEMEFKLNPDGSVSPSGGPNEVPQAPAQEGIIMEPGSEAGTGAKSVGGQVGDLIKDSDTQNFMQDVIDASNSVPVIVDFWAPWCGPCKTLGPMLEKAVKEAGGTVRMVKINVDENQELAMQMRVQSIPVVYAFKDGQPVDAREGPVDEHHDLVARHHGGEHHVQTAPPRAGDAEGVGVLGAHDLAQHFLALDHSAQHVAVHVIGKARPCIPREDAGVGVARPGTCCNRGGNFELGERNCVRHSGVLFSPAHARIDTNCVET